MRTTFDIPKDLRDSMETAREREGYSVKQKSRWICEAVLALRQEDPAGLTVGWAEDLSRSDSNPNIKMPLNTTQEVLDVIKDIKISIRQDHPESEGIVGQVIRAAIRKRIKYGLPTGVSA